MRMDERIDEEYNKIWFVILSLTFAGMHTGLNPGMKWKTILKVQNAPFDDLM